MLPKVSVIIPTYNRSKVIQRAVDSVLAQCYSNLEILVVDDGSNDSTDRVMANKYGDKKNVHFIKRPANRKKGANTCRNIGIEQATGEYVALLDSDDEWTSFHIEMCIETAGKSLEFFGCYSGVSKIYAKREEQIPSRPINEDETYIDFLLSERFGAQTSTLFMQRTAALETRFDESLQRHQDWDFFIRFGRKYSWVWNNGCHAKVHIRGNHDFTAEEFTSFIRFYNKYEKDISKQEIRKNYLYDYYKSALLSNNRDAIDFYSREIKKRRFESGFAFRYPLLFRAYKKIVKTFKLSGLRQAAQRYISGSG